MFVVDTNVLIHAVNVDSPRHGPARELVESLRRSTTPWALTWSILYEFWRVSTHPRVFRSPLRRDLVRAFVAALTASRALQLLAETDRHLDFFEQVLSELPDPAANLAHDAHVVALMREHGVQDIYSSDADFHRFAGIRVHDPFRR
jgi:toxin-antitoxin system PIN domain toxin